MSLPLAKRPRASGVRRSSLSMYAQAPDVELAMSELEECCYMRLRLLRCVDHAKAKGLRGEELQRTIAAAEKEIMRPTGVWSEEELHRDECSHFLLRLAFCRTEELRRYFLSNEHELFKFRFSGQVGDVARFLRDNGMPYRPIDEAELDDVLPQLQNVRRSVRLGKDAGASVKEDHYKVPFEEVLDLVRGRRVYLRCGFAYVPQSELVSIVGGQFRARLSKALVDASRAWPAVQQAEADRLSAFLEHCSTQYMADDYAAEKKAGHGEVSLAQLPALTKRSFPLCMEHLSAKLHDNSHLKHQGRIQLGLFLKGIGLSYDESLAYWRGIFLKGMAPDKFEKEHKYNIRYNYGLEARAARSAGHARAHCRRALTPTGRPFPRAAPPTTAQGAKKNYTPYSCAKVISTVPAAGEHHGCPFRNLAGEPLRAMLSRLSLKPSDVSRIAAKASEHHYQVACGYARSRAACRSRALSRASQARQLCLTLRTSRTARPCPRPPARAQALL